MRVGLTEKQQKVYSFLKQRQDAGEPCPSLSEIAACICSNNRNAAHQIIVCLEERGYVRRLPHRARAIRVVEESNDAESLRSNLLNRLSNIGTGILTVEYVQRMVREMPS